MGTVAKTNGKGYFGSDVCRPLIGSESFSLATAPSAPNRPTFFQRHKDSWQSRPSDLHGSSRRVRTLERSSSMAVFLDRIYSIGYSTIAAISFRNDIGVFWAHNPVGIIPNKRGKLDEWLQTASLKRWPREDGIKPVL